MKTNNLDFIMLGEIYLKKGPEIFDAEKHLEEISDEISDIEFDMSKENPDFSGAKKLEQYKSLKNIIKNLEGKTDYSGTDSFWQISSINDSKIEIKECRTMTGDVRTYKNIKVLQRDFIKLSDFLSKATFVGREFKRTTPIKTSTGKIDKSYIPFSNGPRYIVLYATQDLFLIKRIDSYGEEKYSLINSRYTLDGKYEFFGPVHEQYKDKIKVYRDIVTQIEEDNKKYRRK